jgi:hypothetical protein
MVVNPETDLLGGPRTCRFIDFAFLLCENPRERLILRGFEVVAPSGRAWCLQHPKTFKNGSFAIFCSSQSGRNAIAG